MSLHQWLIYVSVVLAIIVTPGPSAILCISHGAAHGALRTTATIVGGMSASVTLMMLSALGLGAAIAASDTLFHVIKYLGAAYLVYLGVSTWLAVDGSVMLCYAKCGEAISKRLKSSRLGKAFNRITGGAFVAAGGALAVANR